MKRTLRIIALVLLFTTFIMPAALSTAQALRVYEIDYDHDDRELEFDFDMRVRYKKCAVKIIDTVTNKIVKLKITDKDSNDLQVRFAKKNRLKLGRTYEYVISGICDRATRTWQKLSGTFVARDR